MAGKKESKKMDYSFDDDFIGDSGVTITSSASKLRKICPLGMRVLVRIRKDSNQTDAGLYLPQGAKEASNESLVGEVLEVASAIDDETKEEANISGVPRGSLVLIPRLAGTKIPWDDDLRIVETKEVLAIIYEANLS